MQSKEANSPTERSAKGARVGHGLCENPRDKRGESQHRERLLGALVRHAHQVATREKVERRGRIATSGAEKNEQQSSRKRPNLEKAHSGCAASKGFKKQSNVIPDKKSRA